MKNTVIHLSIEESVMVWSPELNYILADPNHLHPTVIIDQLIKRHVYDSIYQQIFELRMCKFISSVKCVWYFNGFCWRAGCRLSCHKSLKTYIGQMQAAKNVWMSFKGFKCSNWLNTHWWVNSRRSGAPYWIAQGPSKVLPLQMVKQLWPFFALSLASKLPSSHYLHIDCPCKAL